MAFENVQTIDDILDNKCDSFFHYEIFQALSNNYCKACKSKELNYEKHFSAYIRKTKVSDFMQSVELKKTFVIDSKKLTFKIGSIKMSNKLVDIVDIKNNLAALLGLRKYTLYLINVEDGSATFLIPKEVADVVFVRHHLSVEQIENARCLSVLSLQCGKNTEIDFTNEDCAAESGNTLSSYVNSYQVFY